VLIAQITDTHIKPEGSLAYGSHRRPGGGPT
jgi:hypothetical protein